MHYSFFPNILYPRCSANGKVKLPRCSSWLLGLALPLGYIFFPSVAQAAPSCTAVVTPSPSAPFTQSSTQKGITQTGVAIARVTSMSVTRTVTYTCNSETTSLKLLVGLGNISAPQSSTGGQNIDWLGTGGGEGVRHRHTISVINNVGTDTPISNVIQNSIANSLFGTGRIYPVGSSGQVTLTVISTFETTAGAEEMFNGGYSTNYSVQAIPQGATNGSTIFSFLFNGSSNVAKECAVSSPTAATTGNYNIAPDLTSMSATGGLDFDCNSGQVAYSIKLLTIQAPNLLKVDHLVQATLTGSSSTTLAQQTAESAGAFIYSGSGFTTNGDGDMGLSLSSKFVPTPPEIVLPSGTYTTRYSVTVTAQ